MEVGYVINVFLRCTELGRTTNSNLTSYKLVANPNPTYHTRITSWPLTSYTHAKIRFLPPTPIEEVVLVAHLCELVTPPGFGECAGPCVVVV